MATNPSNSNAINIINLPEAQIAANGDYLILETPNGTQIIDFQSFNVVKTDIFGNATVVGDLTGKNALLANVRVTSLSASEIFTTRGQGVNASNDYYDRLTIEDGIVLSASRNTETNPIYTRITQTVIPAATGYLLSLFRRTAEESGNETFPPGVTTTQAIVIPSFYDKYPWINPQSVNPSDFNLVGVFVPEAGINALRAGIDINNTSLQTLNSIFNTPQIVTSPSPPSPPWPVQVSNLIRSIPSLSSLPICPTIFPNDITITSGNGLQFKINLPYPSFTPNTSIRVYWKFMKTG